MEQGYKVQFRGNQTMYGRLIFFTDYEQIEYESDRSTYQVFIGYEKEKIRWGAQYSNQNRQAGPGLELFSAFVVGSFYKNISAIARVDRIMKPSSRVNNISYWWI